MKKLIFALSAMLFAFTFQACESTDVVESGTYQGTIKEVEPAKDEIYVSTEDGETLELYFTEETELTKMGEPADFGMLQEGQKVEVEVEKVGQRLDPLSVKILE
jgi:hypothetical protein